MDELGHLFWLYNWRFPIALCDAARPCGQVDLSQLRGVGDCAVLHGRGQVIHGVDGVAVHPWTGRGLHLWWLWVDRGDVVEERGTPVEIRVGLTLLPARSLPSSFLGATLARGGHLQYPVLGRQRHYLLRCGPHG